MLDVCCPSIVNICFQRHLLINYWFDFDKTWQVWSIYIYGCLQDEKFKISLRMGLGSWNRFKPFSKSIFLLTVLRRCFFCGSFLLVMLHVVVCCNVVFVLCSLVVNCLERADLLAILSVLCFLSLSQMCPGPHQNQGWGWRRETGWSLPVKYFTERSKAVLLLWIFYDFSVLCMLCLYVTCWEGADLLAFVCCVFILVCHFPIGILGQVWYLIVSIPDICTLTYFVWNHRAKSLDIWYVTSPSGLLAKLFILPVTYIRVTGHFIFQPYRYVVACVMWLTPCAPFIVHTQNGDAACETAAFIGTLKSVLRRKYRLLVKNNNRKNLYEILLKAMFLQCKN